MSTHTESRVASLKDSVIDVKDHTVEGLTGLIARAGRLIKEHPLAAVGISIGIGYLVVRLVRR